MSDQLLYGNLTNRDRFIGYTLITLVKTVFCSVCGLYMELWHDCCKDFAFPEIIDFWESLAYFLVQIISRYGFVLKS